MVSVIEDLNYRSLSRHIPGENPSLQAIKPAIIISHFHENINGFISKRDVIIHGYNMVHVVHDFPRFQGNYAHVHTVDNRPLFRGGVWPGNEAILIHVVAVLHSMAWVKWCN